MPIDYAQLPSPCYVLDEARLRRNLLVLRSIQEETGVKIILAFKGFAMWSTFPLIRQYLAGATASSLHEARLCAELMGRRAHTYAPAYLPDEFSELLTYTSHLTFNSLNQYERYFPTVQQFLNHPISCGLRVNPEYSEVDTELYNPCAPGTRLGILAEQLGDRVPPGVEGLHFHTLCESNSYALEKTLLFFEERFGRYLPQLQWVNFGGGHLMTDADYDLRHLRAVLAGFSRRYPHLEIILEPGSAVAWQTGELLTTVLDIVDNKGVRTALLDASFTAHMPDTLEMPYRPRVHGAFDPGRVSADTLPPHRYRLGGISCLAGDYLEAYAFERELQVGDRLVFADMMHYTMVKTTTFNGVKHPSIVIWTEKDQLRLVRRFAYEDFKNRLS